MSYLKFSTAEWRLHSNVKNDNAMTNVITRVKLMASINIRVDDELKARAYQELERLRKLPDCYHYGFNRSTLHNYYILSKQKECCRIVRCSAIALATAAGERFAACTSILRSTPKCTPT